MKEFEMIVGCFYLILGISLLFNRDFWVSYIEKIQNDPTLIISIGFPALLLGLSIITFHNIWVWDFPVIVTILGWIIVIKYVLIFITPKFMLDYSKRNPANLRCFRCYGVSLMILALLVLYSANPFFK